jgi:membrane protease YdiL (CAAX protease family)
MKEHGTGSEGVRAVATLVAAAVASTAIVWWGPEAIAAALPTVIDLDARPRAGEAAFTALIFGPMLVVALIGGFFAKVRPFAPGGRPGPNLATGAAIGLAGVLAAMFYAWLGGDVTAGATPETGAGALLLGLGVVVLQAGAEEVYFRGWLQPVLQRAWGAVAAVAVTAVVFAALHVVGGARAPLSIVNMVLGGVLFGVLAVRGGGIAGAVGAHVAWNATEQLVLGLDPNPGLGTFGSLLDLELAGASIWGGSEEGLNASLGMTIALVAILAPMAVLSLRRPRAEEAVPA